MITIRFPRFAWFDWRARVAGEWVNASAHWKRDQTELHLNAQLPWAIELRGGARRSSGPTCGRSPSRRSRSRAGRARCRSVSVCRRAACRSSSAAGPARLPSCARRVSPSGCGSGAATASRRSTGSRSGARADRDARRRRCTRPVRDRDRRRREHGYRPGRRPLAGGGRARFFRCERACHARRSTPKRRGKFDPSLPVAFRLARLFDLRIEEIFLDDRSRATTELATLDR